MAQRYPPPSPDQLRRPNIIVPLIPPAHMMPGTSRHHALNINELPELHNPFRDPEERADFGSTYRPRANHGFPRFQSDQSNPIQSPPRIYISATRVDPESINHSRHPTDISQQTTDPEIGCLYYPRSLWISPITLWITAAITFISLLSTAAALAILFKTYQSGKISTGTCVWLTVSLFLTIVSAAAGAIMYRGRQKRKVEMLRRGRSLDSQGILLEDLAYNHYHHGRDQRSTRLQTNQSGNSVEDAAEDITHSQNAPMNNNESSAGLPPVLFAKPLIPRSKVRPHSPSKEHLQQHAMNPNLESTTDQQGRQTNAGNDQGIDDDPFPYYLYGAYPGGPINYPDAEAKNPFDNAARSSFDNTEGTINNRLSDQFVVGSSGSNSPSASDAPQTPPEDDRFQGYAVSPSYSHASNDSNSHASNNSNAPVIPCRVELEKLPRHWFRELAEEDKLSYFEQRRGAFSLRENRLPTRYRGSFGLMEIFSANKGREMRGRVKSANDVDRNMEADALAPVDRKDREDREDREDRNQSNSPWKFSFEKLLSRLPDDCSHLYPTSSRRRQD